MHIVLYFEKHFLKCVLVCTWYNSFQYEFRCLMTTETPVCVGSKQTLVFKLEVVLGCLQKTSVCYTIHCPKNSLNFRTKTKPVVIRAYAMASVWFLCQIYPYVNKGQTSTVASAPAMTYTVFYAEIQIIFGTVYFTLFS